MAKRKRRKITRQDWKPRGLLWILRGVWLTALSAVKLAVGAAATVLFIGIICAFVLIGALGDYLQEDVVPNVSFDLDNIDLEQTSFIYYLDGDGQVQKLQQIYADTDYLNKVAEQGAEKARAEVRKTLNEMRQYMGFRKF